MPKLPFGSMAQFVARRPFTTAAAVFAPFFAKSEDRGYFRTALLTTPVIYAVGTAAPKLFSGARDLTIQGARSAKEAADILKKNVEYSANQATSAAVVAGRGGRDFLREQRVLTRLFHRRFIKSPALLARAEAGDLGAKMRIAEIDLLQSGGRGELLTKSLQTARRSAMTMAEYAEGIGEEPTILTQEQMVSMFDKYSSRPEFVKTLRNRLRELKDLKYSGTAKVFSGAPTAATTSALPIDFDAPNFLAERAFREQAPEAFGMFAEAQRQNKIRSVEVEMERSKDVVAGRTGKILSLKVTRKEGKHLKDLIIPLVDRVTGTVVMPGGIAKGVGDYVIGPEQDVHDLATWIAKTMIEAPTIPIEPEYVGAPSLQGEVAAHAYWQVGDPTDARRMAELGSFGDEGSGFYSDVARRLRSRVAKGTTLPVYKNRKGQMVTYSNLTSAEQVALLEEDINTGKFIPMASEAGVYERRYVLREAANLSPWGMPSAEKQDPIWRSVTKEWHIAPRPGIQIPESSLLGWESSAWKGLAGTDTLPGIRETIASISPQDRALFSELSGASKEEIIQKFLDRGMSTENAVAMYEDVEKVRGAGAGQALRNFGAMGETVTFMDPATAANFQVEGSRTYHLGSLGKGVTKGATVEATDVLGFNETNRVLPIGSGVVTDIAQADEGFVATIQHTFGMQGAKTDTAGIKGMRTVSEHFGVMRDVMNNFYRRMGMEDFISDEVNVLAPAEYFIDKVEPAHAYMGLAEGLVNRLHAAGADEVSADFLSKMKAQGITYESGRLMIDAAQNKIASDAAAADRYMELVDVIEGFFRQAGNAIRKAGGYQDPVLTAYVHSGKDLGNWMLKNQFTATTFAWDHSLVNTPKYATITHDVGTYLQMGGQEAALRAIQSRLQTVSGGDPLQTLEFGKYLHRGEFGTEMGTTIPLNEAFITRGPLKTAAARAGSIFDPAIEKYQQNFRIDLGNGQFIPVPGTAAYGAESPAIGPGEYQTYEWQHTLQSLAYEKDAAAKAELQERLISQYKESFLTGKHSAFRPHAYDPMGVSGVLGVAAEEGDPFAARISPEVVASVRSQRVREALLRGEDVVGVIHRQPTNFMPFLKYRMDRGLEGTKTIATSERTSRLLFGDVDKDNVDALFFDAHLRMEDNKMVIAGAANDMERAAAQEALDAMQGGKQANIFAAMEEVLGTEEIASLNATYAPKGLYEGAKSFAAKARNRIRVAVNRTAGAAIGGYSNELTEVTEHIARSPFFMQNYEAAARLNAITFSMIRQAPISARKAKGTFSLETAMQKLNQLRSAIANENSTTSAQSLHETFMSLGRNIHGEDWMTKTEYQYLAGEKAMSDMSAWAQTRTEKGRLAKQALTSTIDRGRPFEEQFAAKNLPRLMEDIPGMLGAHHGGRMAEETATKMGRLSEMLAEKGRAVAEVATGKLGATFTKHGRSMAIGLGAMAALGVALTSRRTPIATFSRQSSNAYRPEDRMGVADNIPGEPMAGEMAPSNPPRRQLMGSGGVRKAMVAPMRQTSDLSVRMSAVDHARAAETARQIAMIPGSGDTNVTINYRDRTKLRSLRTREKIREINA